MYTLCYLQYIYVCMCKCVCVYAISCDDCVAITVFGNYFKKEITSLLQVYHIKLQYETSFLARET